MNIYIISYFGPRLEHELRESRKQTHKEQIEWLIDHGHNPIVLNQDYGEDDFLPNVTYVGENKQMTASDARNVLLDIFYNSDDDYAAFADNDTVYKDNIFDYDPLDKVTANANLLRGKVDLLFALNPITFPFNKEIKEQWDEYNRYFCFRKTDNFKESLFVMANTFKFYGERHYFNVEMFKDEQGRMICGEGPDFVLNLLSKGRTALQYKQLILHERNSKSTWNVERDQERYRLPTRIREYWIEKYNIPVKDMNDVDYDYIGYTINKKGKVSYRKFSDSKYIEKMKSDAGIEQFVYHKLPTPMNNYAIAEYLDVATDLDETLAAYPKSSLTKEMSVRRDLSNLYQHVDFTQINAISLDGIVEERVVDSFFDF